MSSKLENVSIEYFGENEAEAETPGEYLSPGYYYSSCFPGCLPDSEWYGPFESYDEAYAEALEEWGEDEEEWDGEE